MTKIKDKGQVSIEYILIFAAILSIGITYFHLVSSIYSKNLVSLDNKYLDSISCKIQEDIDLIEIQPIAKKIIDLENRNCWKVYKKDQYSFCIENLKKNKIIRSNCKIELKDFNICKGEDLILEKKRNEIRVFK